MLGAPLVWQLASMENEEGEGTNPFAAISPSHPLTLS